MARGTSTGWTGPRSRQRSSRSRRCRTPLCARQFVQPSRRELHAQVGHVAKGVVEAVGEVGRADHQGQLHDLPLVVILPQVLERAAADGPLHLRNPAPSRKLRRVSTAERGTTSSRRLCGRASRTLIQFAGFQDSVENTVDKGLIDAHPFLRTPVHVGDGLFYEDWHTMKQNLAALDVIHPIGELWDKEFRHKPTDYKSDCVLVKWSADDACAVLFSLWFGQLAVKEDLRDDFTNAFLKGLKAKEATIERDAELNASLSEQLPPLEFTRRGLRTYGGSWPREQGLYVGEATDFDDLVNFWNLRASGIEIEYLPWENIARFNAYTRAYLEKVDALPGRIPGDTGAIAIHYKQGQHERTAATIAAFRQTKRFLFCECNRHTWNGLNVHATKNYFGWHNQLASVDRKFERFTVSFSLPEMPADADKSGRYSHFQQLVAVVSATSDFEYPSYTLNPPFIRELNEFLSREIAVDPWKLRTGPDGIGLVVQLHDSSEWLYPVSHRDLILKVFELAGMTVELSPAGLLADQIIRGMRETEPLEACRVFKIRGVRQLLKWSGDSTTWNEAVATIGRAAFAKYKPLYIKARRTPELAPQDAVSFLLEKNIIAPQLQWWPRLIRTKKDFRCRACGLRSLIHMASFEGIWRCGYCGHEEHLPSLIGEEFRNKTEWRFRKSGFFAKENSQEGAIPVILTLLQMKRRLHTTGFVFSTALALKFPTGNPCEVDLALLHPGRRGDNIELGLGECKDEGGKIEERDMANLRRVLGAIQKVRGIKPFLVFSRTADSFAPEEIALFRQLKADHIRPILFTNRELEPYDPYEEHRTVKLPFPYALSLEEMAANSDYIYLR